VTPSSILGTMCANLFMMAWRVLPRSPPNRSSRWLSAIASLYLERWKKINPIHAQLLKAHLNWPS
jgi:hypothetical protein